MERYRFSDVERSLMEGMSVPFAVFQLVDNRIATLIVSDGFCELVGSGDRADIYAAMDHDPYRRVHPDDVARLGNAVYRFMKDGDRLECVYRLKAPDGSGHIVIHAQGRHVAAPSGERLAQVWFADEGAYSEKLGREGTPLSEALNNALHEESILRASYYDYLTGLPSMTYFFELAEAGRAAIRAQGGDPALLYMDFSGMKFYNSRHGFAEGDRLLRAFARILIRLFGLERCCHMGADHFAVLTEEAGLEEKLQALFGECGSINDGRSLPVHVGVYPVRSEKAHISVACDRAKLACSALSGRYGTAVNTYSHGLIEDAEKKHYIVENLEKAISEGWIRVYYQPIVRSVDEKVCDEEALARWIDPVKGFFSPAEFIPALEEARLIHRLDLYMLEQVLEKMKGQAAAGRHVVPHSINLSRYDFNACDIVEEIRSRVDASGIARNRISIEITESVIGSDFDFMKAQVERFRSLGFPVWMDDFGSGYSSLDVLQSIQFDLIKFDMSFMRKLDEGENGKIILAELMKLAISLDVDTVCEGVETARQVRFLQEIGCSKLQGFYYCKPLPLEELIEKGGQGERIGYEDPLESAYYETIGRVNLYDLSVIAKGHDAALHNAFNTLPMGILEIRNGKARYIRSSQSYRDFMVRFFGFDIRDREFDFSGEASGFGSAFTKAVSQCGEGNSRAFFDETAYDGSRVHAFVRRIGFNPVSGSVAVAIAVLSVSEPNGDRLVEQILSVAEQFGEHVPGGFFIYRADERQELLYANRAVCDIFGCDSQEDFRALTGYTFPGMVHPEDRARALEAIRRRAEAGAGDQELVEYRIVRKDGGIRWIDDYSNYMATGARGGIYYVFISDFTERRLQAESDRALRSAVIETLTRAYDSVWLISDLQTQRFELYRIDKETAHLMPAHEAVKIERFSQAFAFYSRLVLEEDRQRFLEGVSPENIVKNTNGDEIYSVPFRLVFDSGVRYYRVEFARLDMPGGGAGIVCGFRNVDAQTRRDQQAQRSFILRAAVIEALTRAYDSVWLIRDLETQRFELYRVDEQMAHRMPAQAAVKLERFYDAFTFYSKLVLEEDRQRFLDGVSPESIARNTVGEGVYSVSFRRVFEDGVRHYRVEFTRQALESGEDLIVAGFRDVDAEVRGGR